MAAYFAMRIMDKAVTYAQVMSVAYYAQYKDDIDAILIAEGKADLITQ